MSVTISGSGQIVKQVVTLNFTTQLTVSGQSFQTITGYTATITPTNSANKILVLTDLKFSGGSDVTIRMKRNGTEVDSGAGGSTNNGFINSQTGTYGVTPGCQVFIDSPATTSACVYTFEIWQVSSSAINRRNGDASYGSASNITLMEIAYA